MSRLQRGGPVARKNKWQKKSFESTGSSSDTSANIYESMLQSKAWQELTATQKVLYLTCKSQYFSEKTKTDSLNFTMNRKKWLKYKLYKDQNRAGFIRDMSALIEKGFISCVACGANAMVKSVYRFSDRWQTGVEICEEEKTAAMQGRKKKRRLLAGPERSYSNNE